MPGIVWLASYPKSGNTWLRVFLQSYQNAGGPVAINDLAIRNAAHHALFDQFGLVEVSDLTEDEVSRLRPALYRAIASDAAGPVILKVHDAFGSTSDGVPLFPAAATRSVVYIVRHPCDVAVSMAHQFGSSIDDAVAMLGREEAFVRVLGGQCRQRLRSWRGHVTSWVDESALPVCVVRYEDLLTDAVREFSRVVSAAGVAGDLGRLESAIAQSSFDRLRAQERAHGFVERASTATAPFFRIGRSGGWRRHVTADQVRRLVDVHGDVMRRFGYLTAAGDPIG